jgi:hypothetical protein
MEDAIGLFGKGGRPGRSCPARKYDFVCLLAGTEVRRDFRRAEHFPSLRSGMILCRSLGGRGEQRTSHGGVGPLSRSLPGRADRQHVWQLPAPRGPVDVQPALVSGVPKPLRDAVRAQCHLA